MGYLSEKQLEAMNFATVGTNVLLSEKASIYNPQNIKLGSNVRIDDFCIISAGEEGIEIGNHVHIACYVSLIGRSKIKLGNYVGISSKTAVYSSSDDYSGNFLTGPTVDCKFRNVDERPVIFESHSLIGAGCIILPGVIIGEGTAVGALSLVSKNLDPWGIYVGVPIKFIKTRNKKMLDFISSVK